MDYKFYKTTDLEFIGKLQRMRDHQIAYMENINKVASQVGAYDCLHYRSGGIACFKFKQEPDRKVWKKSHDGFLPKVSNKYGKEIDEQIRAVKQPKPLDDALKEYKFPMLVMGEATARGVMMHDSTLFGKFDKKTFFVRVPTSKNCDFKPPEIFTEVKEWEALKFMDEEKAA